ncbi:MAG: hypothetical protein M3N13_03590, partial [Candidatus Eremiobacteraeota bacterium]|nr:hypothetical protein [Candidatus Eremiobacteraeota bacterium]
FISHRMADLMHEVTEERIVVQSRLTQVSGKGPRLSGFIRREKCSEMAWRSFGVRPGQIVHLSPNSGDAAHCKTSNDGCV